MTLARYPKLKFSGSHWIGNVPAHWQVGRLKDVLSDMSAGGTPDTSDPAMWPNAGENGTAWVAIGDMSTVEVVLETQKTISEKAIVAKRLKVWPAGTLLFSMYASLGHTAFLGVRACTNQAILAMIPSRVSGAFLKYWLMFLQVGLVSESSTNTQDNLNATKVARLPAVIPPVGEQAAIVEYLDRELVEIDALLTARTNFVALLQEKRRATIREAVTHGLNPDAKMITSDKFRMGTVPAHWTIMPFKKLANIQNGADHQKIAVEGGKYPVFGSGGEFARASEHLYAGPSVLMGRKGTLDKPIYVNEPFWAVDTVFWTKIAPNSDARYVYYLAQTIPYDYYATKTAIPSMTKSALSAHPVACPPLQEQIKIAEFLDREMSGLDQLLARQFRMADLLLEKRAVLINAAVTGKIRVTDQQRRAA